MENNAPATVEEQDLVKGGSVLRVMSESLEINNADSMAIAYSMLSDIVRLKKQVESFFAPAISAAYTAHKEILKKRNELLESVLVAERTVRRKQEQYYADQEERSRALQIEAHEAATVEDSLLVSIPKPTEQEELPTREMWDFDVFDPKMLVMAVFEGKAPAKYLTVNMAEIGRDVRKQKEGFSCPGVSTKKRIIAVNR